MCRDGNMGVEDNGLIGACKSDSICVPPGTVFNMHPEPENSDWIGIYFTMDGMVDAYLNRSELPKPIIKFLASQSCKSTRNVLFVKLTENRKEN